MNTRQGWRQLSFSLLTLLMMVVCGVGRPAAASAATFWGLTTNQTLVKFTSDAPGTILQTLPITGIAAGERIVGIQVLTTDGTLVGVGSGGHVYSIDRHTGAATQLPTTGSGQLPVLSGAVFGVTESHHSLLVASDTGQITAINQGTWDTAPTASWSAGHWVAASWYFLPTPPPFSSQVDNSEVRFALDSTTDTLYQIAITLPPFAGTSVNPVGPLGVDISDIAGMDGDFHDGVLYAALTVGGTPGLYRIDTASGHATLLGAIGAPTPIASLSIETQMTPVIQQISTPPPPGSGGTWQEANVTIDYALRRTGDDSVPGDYTVQTTNPIGVVAGVDYLPLAPQVLHFAAGEVEKHVSVQLLDDSVRESNKAFTLNFSDNTPGGLAASFVIDIIDDENKAPAIAVTSPTTSVSASTDSYTITGTVIDEDPNVTINTSTVLPTPLSVIDPVHTDNGTWSVTVPLHQGYNEFQLQASDIFNLFSPTTPHVVIWRGDVADRTFVFAEGATGGFFRTELLFANPGFTEVPIAIDFMREDGASIPYATTLPPAGRVTLDVGSIPGLEATATAAVVHTNTYPIVAERTMTWDTQGYGASTEKGASALSTSWLFAEGSQGFFKTFLLLVNPQSSANDVTVRFLREGTTPVTKSYTMGPHQRLTIDAAAIPELQNQSFGMEVTFAQPGVAERSMYFGDSPLWTGGHESAGAPAASTDWFLAEGATGPFFKTFLLLANPSSEPADVTLTYLPSTGVPVTSTKQVPANGRLTVNIEFEDPSLQNAAVATQVKASRPIVVERSQYWPGSPDQWYEAHNSFGLTAPAQHWGLAEGRLGGPQGYQTYILMANPQVSSTFVTVRFLREDGGDPVTKIYQIPATSRFNLLVDHASVPELPDGAFGAEISSELPIMVERSLYWNAIGQIWAAGTNATATRLP